MFSSLIDSEKTETEDLNEKTDKVEKREDAAIIFKEYEDVNRTKKKNIVCISKEKCLKYLKRRKSS